jgi:modification methylase
MLVKSELSAEVLNATASSIPLKAETVTVTVTSPPYHNAIDYDRHLKSKGWYRGNLGSSLETYLVEMKECFLEVLRVTKKSGFCCIVIGNELSNGTIIPLPHLITNVLCSEDNWRFHEEIIWNKVTGGLDRFGVTIQRPFPTYYRANIMHEQILVFRKGDLEHTKDEGSKFVIDDVMKKDTSNSIWNIAPVPPKYIEHPCPFPEEIPLRLITLYSNKGDLVMDPFMGSGQTGKAARHLGRKFLGFDIQGEYCALSKRRIENEELHVRASLIPKWEKTDNQQRK